MALFATDDGLILTEEGSACRARSGSLNYLFRESTEERVREAYLVSRKFTQSLIAPRWNSIKSDELNSRGLENLIQEITLHWMYYYIVNSLQVDVTTSDISHPQTRRIIRKHMERNFNELPDKAIEAGAILFDVSVNEFKRGIEGDDHLAEMW